MHWLEKACFKTLWIPTPFLINRTNKNKGLAPFDPGNLLILMQRQSQEQSTGMITMNMALLVISQHTYTWTPVPALLTRGRMGAVLGGRRGWGGSLCSCAKSSKTRLFKKEKKKERQASPHSNDPTCKASDSSHPASRQHFTAALGRTPTFSSLKSSSTLQSLATQAWRPRRDGYVSLKEKGAPFTSASA